ncbi:hypothetical protein ACSBQT_10745 [Brevibacterium sp. H602]|uniref:hypothetical protein n=1 Tax=Brevibacterium sp. H602 TaxID=3444316 RepID=UPI003EBB921F
MSAQIPDIEFPEPNGDEATFFLASAAVNEVERYVRLLLKLHGQGSEEFYSVGRQVQAVINSTIRKARRFTDNDDRKELLRSLYRCKSTASFLIEFGPYVEGSGGQRPGRPNTAVKSVKSGGLPGLGKRN